MTNPWPSFDGHAPNDTPITREEAIARVRRGDCRNM
jgi:hypothetical protein